MKNLYKIEDELYIVSDKEKSSYCIKECPMLGLNIDRCDCQIFTACSNKVGNIILTTNKLLIKNGVQAIDAEFLEWFIKNSNCEFVETERLENGRYVDFLPNGDTEEGVYENYKIIIPKEELYNETQQKSLEFNKSLVKSITTEELDLLMSKFDDIEPKQREMFLLNANTVIYTRKPKEQTLEEAAKNYAIDNSLIGYELMPYKGFIEGAKWQQERSYSEDEVKTIINDIVEKHCAYFKQETKDVVKLEWLKTLKRNNGKKSK